MAVNPNNLRREKLINTYVIEPSYNQIKFTLNNNNKVFLQQKLLCTRHVLHHITVVLQARYKRPECEASTQQPRGLGPN